MIKQELTEVLDDGLKYQIEYYVEKLLELGLNKPQVEIMGIQAVKKAVYREREGK